MTSARDLTLRLADLLRRERASLAESLVALAAELRPCEAAPHRVVVTALRPPAVAPALSFPAPSAEPLAPASPASARAWAST